MGDNDLGPIGRGLEHDRAAMLALIFGCNLYVAHDFRLMVSNPVSGHAPFGLTTRPEPSSRR
jgi:hypothetical protein